MDGRELRNCFGKFPTGVTIVSRFDGSVQKGITVNSLPRFPWIPRVL